VPGGGEYEVETIADHEVAIYKYPIDRDKLIKPTRKTLEAAGWSVTINASAKTPDGEATKGSAEVGMLFGKPTDGSTLLLFLRHE